MSRRLSEHCLSDLQLDRWLADELEPEQVARASAHVAECLPCRARREALRKDREDFVLAPPALRLPELEGSGRPSSRRSRWVLAAIGAVAAAAALALLLRGRVTPPELVSVNDVVRAKGSPFELAAVVERGDHQVRARSGDRVHRGDRVQLAYSTMAPVFLVVVGVDGTKQATVYFPEAEVPQRVEPGSEVELPFSLVLDATPGAETFVAVACGEARLPKEVARAVEGAGAGVELPGCDVATLRLEKSP